MDDDIFQIIKDLGFASKAYEKCFKTNEELNQQIKILKSEILKSHEAENIQNNSLFMSRKLIGEQQAIIAKLVSVKEELKLCKADLDKKSKQIEELQEEKSVLFMTYQKEQEDIVRNHTENLEIVRNECENEVHILKKQFEIALSESETKVRELSIQMEQIQMRKDEQINSLIVEYENQLQRAHAHSLQMRDEFQILHDKNRANIAIYKKRLEDFEYSKNSNKKNNIEATDNTNDFVLISNENDFKTSKNNEFLSRINKKTTVQGNNDSEVKPAAKPVKRKLFNKYMEYISNE